VTGTNGKNHIEARGASQDEAWRNTVLQAEAVGMAGRAPQAAQPFIGGVTSIAPAQK
jgi:hypothetical protein